MGYATKLVPLLLACGLLLQGCAPDPIPMASEAETLAGRQFAPPRPGLAAVYIYCKARSCPTTSIQMDQRQLGVLQKTWLRVEVKPGRHDFRCNIQVLRDPGGFLTVDVAAGETFFIDSAFVPLGSPSCRLRLEPAEVGRDAILTLPRSHELQGASD